MAGVLDTLLSYLLGGKYAGLQRNHRPLLTLLDLHRSPAKGAGLRLGHKLDIRKWATFLERRPCNLSR